ncbi:metal-sensitive transcriptional regulator [Halanaerobacter jeridensis]|uniref:DNA-binding FrmR family transcriptional regulator n=1 Tax=Halanaerobacter jeridensis TaxID=706427 RepID=A0A938XRB5_9FIRM|nr:metal-sensitive transcriptional regulator [Halanaerobacter jeridensis]MBM7555963.1 DNA-binding FrmR family transcriptional regulator [Halanaerobacter jeridensis]
MAELEDEEVKKEVISRLRTIKGHIGGVEKMVENDKDCKDILLQISAIKSSVNKLGLYLAENNVCEFITESLEEGEEVKTAVEEAMTSIFKFTE